MGRGNCGTPDPVDRANPTEKNAVEPSLDVKATALRGAGHCRQLHPAEGWMHPE